jgi:L-ornithine N5-monooxygenase
MASIIERDVHPRRSSRPRSDGPAPQHGRHRPVVRRASKAPTGSSSVLAHTGTAGKETGCRSGGTVHREVELLAVGAGPSNLALAVALEELAPADLAVRSLVVERSATVSWQPGMLLPWTRSQVSFLKDLVTMRDPCSPFSFVNYLHKVGRLDAFTNMGSFTPYRLEISEYLRWVAESLTRVSIEYGRTCTSVEPLFADDGTVTRWLTRLADGSTITSRYLVVGCGRDPHVPAPFDALPRRRVVHSTEFVPRLEELADGRPGHVVVVGGAQSAAEMFHSLADHVPDCRRTLVMRSIGLNNYESSKFTNELYYPGFVGEFFAARPAAREQLLREMHRTNYSGIAPSLLETLYSDLYLDRLTGRDRMAVVTMADVTGAREDGGGVVLDLTDRKSGAVTELRCDVVLLGTGFVRQMPRMVRSLAGALELDQIEVDRRYRVVLDRPATAACWLQGVNEATHGIADSLLSVLAHRSWEIADDVIAHRAALDEREVDDAAVADAPAYSTVAP